MLDSSRKHWCIENRLHYVRDVTFDEDRSRVRRGAGAQVMASIRNLALSILRIAGARYIPSALRCCARQGDPFVFRLIGVRLYVAVPPDTCGMAFEKLILKSDRWRWP